MEEDPKVRMKITHGQVHVECVIEICFHLLKENVLSPSFCFSQSEWQLMFWIDEIEDWIGLFLCKKESEEKCYIDYRIGIKKNDGSELHAFKKKYTFTKENRVSGTHNFFRKSSFQDILSLDASWTVFCTARTADDTTEVETQTTSPYDSFVDLSNLVKDLESLYLDRQYSDIKIRVKNKELEAHKCIIAARSKVFAAMFRHDTAEKKSGTVEVDDCDPDSFEDFIHYLYTGNIDLVSSSNALILYKIADKYDVEKLKEECIQCMIRELSVDSFTDVLCLATMHFESRLLTAATTFFVKKSKAILQTTKWLRFLAENTSLGNELILKALDKQEDELLYMIL